MHRRANRGTPQGAVLSPLLWTLVVNRILLKLRNEGPKLTAYADDLAIIISGRCLNTMSQVLEGTLKEISKWAVEAGLKVNPEKTDLVLFTRKYKIPNWTPPRLDNITLQVKTYTKYLGVILDSKLTWRLNVEERAKKALNALYACRKMVGKTWGLSPRLSHWIYTAVVRPIMLYGILVWQTSLNKKTYANKLEKVQRVAELCITGAMRTTPTAALDKILDLHPIDLVAKSFAKKSALRLLTTGQLVQRPYGHSWICRGLNANSDYVIPQANFNREPKVVLEKDGWQKGQLSTRHTFNIYTDGSKMEEGVGAAVFCPELGYEQSYKLPDYCSVFQAEIYAATKAADLAIENTPPNSQINFYIDSQAAIKAIAAVMTNSHCVRQCRNRMDELGTGKQVTIYWVPGHKGIEGNEKVDTLAKAGANLPVASTAGIQPPLCKQRRDIDAAMIQEANSRWGRTSSCRIAKIMLRRHNVRSTNYILSLPRKECKLVVGILTGHCLTPSHAAKLKLVQNDTCTICKEVNARGTLEHLLCHCPALSRTRINCLGSASFSTLESVADQKISSLLKLSKLCIKDKI